MSTQLIYRSQICLHSFAVSFAVRLSPSRTYVGFFFFVALFHSLGLFFRLISRPLGRAGGAAAEVVAIEPLGIYSLLTPIQAHFDALFNSQAVAKQKM